MRRRQALGVLILGPAVVAACGRGGGPKEPAGLLGFTGRTLDGAAFDGRSLAGKPAVLWFWAPWCATCASEADGIADAARRYAGTVSVLGIAGLGDVTAMHQFVSDYDLGDVRHLDDSAGVLWRRFGITQQSLYVLLRADGTLLTKGFLDNEQFPVRVAALAQG